MSGPAPEEQEYYRLRAEWLRLKNHVYDVNTELPTLVAVLDDVRRLLEERGSLALVFLDLGANAQIEALQGWHAYDELVRGFAARLSGLRQDGTLSQRDVACVLSVRGDKFVLFAGGNGGPPPDRVAAEALVARVRERLLAAQAQTPGSPANVFHLGHAVLQRDPMLRAERSVHRALDEAMFQCMRQRSRDEDRRTRDLDALIDARQVKTLYQPILDLRNLSVLGHEVFSRGPVGGPFEDAEGLFLLAERTGRLREFERLCRGQALSSARRHLGPHDKLFINTSAEALQDPEVAGQAFAAEVERQGLERSQVVLEITERVAVAERSAYQAALRELKRQGFGIAIDDMGAGYSSLRAVVEMEPSYLKFDIALVRNIDRSLIKRSLLETLVELSQKIGSEVIAEGIEAESEFNVLRDLGVKLGQGRYLAPPREVPLEPVLAP